MNKGLDLIQRQQIETIDGYPTGNVYIGLTVDELAELEKELKDHDGLSQLEDLAEQIGCPLDFAATPYKLSGLKKIWYHNQWCEVVRIVVYEEATKPYMEVRCKDYKYLKMILLEDYGKTWALTEKEL